MQHDLFAVAGIYSIYSTASTIIKQSLKFCIANNRKYHAQLRMKVGGVIVGKYPIYYLACYQITCDLRASLRARVYDLHG